MLSAGTNISVIVPLHVAVGAVAGAATGSRLAALLAGTALHLAADAVPHRDTRSPRMEIACGAAGFSLLVLRRGLLDPATIGAAACCAPDAEHFVPFLRPGGEKLFHGRLGWHRSGPLPVGVQLLLAGAILGWLIRHPARPSPR